MNHSAALFSNAPVVGSFQSNGKTVLTLCRRDLRDAICDMGLLTIVPEVNKNSKPTLQDSTIAVSVRETVGVMA